MMIELLSKDREELAALVRSNSVDEVRSFLDTLCVTQNGAYAYCPTRRNIASLLLSTASARASIGELSDEMAYTLIRRLVVFCDLFTFARTVLSAISRKIPEANTHALASVCERFRCNYYTKEVADLIEILDVDETLAMLHYIVTADDIKTLNVAFTVPIICNLYNNAIIRRELILAYSAASLREIPPTLPGIIITV